MAIDPQSLVRSDADGDAYTCPGCGERVDRRETAEMLRHHQHLIAPAAFPPPWFQRRPDPARAAVSSAGADARRALGRTPNESSTAAAEARRRRYGH